MLKYQPDKCNIHNCTSPNYKDNMCQEHYEFYIQDPLVRHVIEEKIALDVGNSSVKLRLKKHLHSFIHHSFDIPMPLYEHFPLEHVFLAELYSARSKQKEDVEHYRKVIEDFDIPENENIAVMKRILNFKDIETSELGPKEKYLLGKKDLPSMIPPMISVLGFFLLYCFFEWMTPANLVIRGADLSQVYKMYCQFIPYAYAFTFFIILGMMIPSQYNYLIERSYNLTLFKRLEENVDLVNQVKYVKERKGRAGSYYATLQGSSLGIIAVIFFVLLGKGTVISSYAVILCCAVIMSIIPLLFSFSEMALFYPVIESLKRKRVSIDLYNADHRGGLKRYHRLIYLTILYNEGIAIILISLFKALTIPRGWVFLLILLLFPRLNHAGWAIFGLIRSIVDFYLTKNEERSRLIVQEGTVDNMGQSELLNKIYPIGFIPLVLWIVLYVLVPYIVNNLPRWNELLVWLGMSKP